MTHGDSFQQIAALRADLQRVAAEVNILRENVLQNRLAFVDYVLTGASPEGRSEPELVREKNPGAAETLSVPEPDMGPED